MNQKTLWEIVNKDLVAKAISELLFEEVLICERNATLITIKTQSGVIWKCEGIWGVWGSPKINPTTITRNNDSSFEASDFFLDIQFETGMDDITLGNFFEEMHNTLLADLHLKERTHSLKVTEIANWNGEKLQHVLHGHPKILLSKGRVGWKASEREAFAPETAKPFQLFWIGVRKELASGELSEDVLSESLQVDELNKLQAILPQGYAALPVHPWQWDRYIATQFIGEISKGDIKPLGLFGDYYLPQTSIRTLYNVTRPERMDVKLPVSILNTSCIRGLPSKYVELGGKLSARLEELSSKDPELRNVRILKEKGGRTLQHPAYSKIKNAPYRYHELLGSLWRESAQGKLESNEKAILTAALFHQDSEGNALIGEYIRRSGKSAEEWLKAFFTVTLKPLLHLQKEYGVGLVAHGQNIALILKNDFPTGMILKDFHGDMRLSKELPTKSEKYFGDVKDQLTTLPPHYLIHDLITGGLITVHRFISLVMKVSENLPEERYYGLMHSVLAETAGKDLLLRETFEKLLVNKVRFKIGYGDSDERPLPMLGGELQNPIVKYKETTL